MSIERRKFEVVEPEGMGKQFFNRKLLSHSLYQPRIPPIVCARCRHKTHANRCQQMTFTNGVYITCTCR